MLTLVNIDTPYLYLSISMAFIVIGIGLADPSKKAIVLSKANQSRIGVITFTFNTIENIIQRVGASFAIIMFALFAAGGNAVNALSSTALFLTIYSAVAFLFLILIPKKVEGFKEKESTIELEEEAQ